MGIKLRPHATGAKLIVPIGAFNEFLELKAITGYGGAA
jgi:hypothetical protein